MNSHPEHALMVAFEEHADALFRHCHLRTLDRAASKALLCEAFTRTWDHLATGQRIVNMRVFLYRTVNALIADWRTTHTGTAQEPASSLPFQMLWRLPSSDRDLLVMHYVDRLSETDIAAMIGIPVYDLSDRLTRSGALLHSLLSHV